MLYFRSQHCNKAQWNWFWLHCIVRLLLQPNFIGRSRIICTFIRYGSLSLISKILALINGSCYCGFFFSRVHCAYAHVCSAKEWPRKSRSISKCGELHKKNPTMYNYGNSGGKGKGEDSSKSGQNGRKSIKSVEKDLMNDPLYDDGDIIIWLAKWNVGQQMWASVNCFPGGHSNECYQAKHKPNNQKMSTKWAECATYSTVWNAEGGGGEGGKKPTNDGTK